MDTPRNNAIPLLLTLLVGIPLCLFVAISLLWAYSWCDTTPRGPLTAVSDWPKPIQELHASLDDASVDTATFSVYLLYGQPAQTMNTVVCRINVNDAGWDTIQRQLDLQPISDSNGGAKRNSIVSSSDPSWWPSPSNTTQYFASALQLAGDEADLYYAARDTASSLAFIHYHFNF